MKWILRLLALAGGLFLVALSFSAGSVDSMFIDFTQLSEDQLSVYKFVFLIGGIALWGAIPVIGE
jgi:hypothetical protein